LGGKEKLVLYKARKAESLMKEMVAKTINRSRSWRWACKL